MVICDGSVGTFAAWYVWMAHWDARGNFAFANARFNGFTFVWNGAAGWLSVMITRTRCAFYYLAAGYGHLERWLVWAFTVIVALFRF